MSTMRHNASDVHLTPITPLDQTVISLRLRPQPNLEHPRLAQAGCRGLLDTSDAFFCPRQPEDLQYPNVIDSGVACGLKTQEYDDKNGENDRRGKTNSQLQR
jgi:hypothetical protein